MKPIRPSLIPGILWLGISTFLLTIPGNKLPTESWLDKIYFDKWVHIGMFSIMVWLWCWGFTRFKAHNKVLERWFLYIAVLWCGYGIGMEFVQRYLVINRSFDMGDIVADSVGCLMGWWYSSRRYIKK